MRTCVLGGAVAGGRAHGVVHAAWTRGAAGVPRRHASVNAATFARQRLWSLFCVCLLSININVFVLHVDPCPLILMPVLCRRGALGYGQRQGTRRLGRGAADGHGGREFVSAAERDQSRDGALSRTRLCVARCRALAHSNGCEWLFGHSSAFCLQAAAEHKWHGVDCGRRNARRGLQWRHQGVQSDLQGDPPVFRHNLLFGHHVGPKRKCPGGLVEVNTTQKTPTWPVLWAASRARGAGKRRDAVSTKRMCRRQRCRKAARCRQHLCLPSPQAVPRALRASLVGGSFSG